MWTGTYPQTHGYWVYWGLSKEERRKNERILSIFEVFPKGKARILARHIFRYFLMKANNPAQAWFMPSLPDELQPYFSRCGVDFHPDTYAGLAPSMFDKLRDSGIKYRWRESHSLEPSDFQPVLVPTGEKFVEVISITNLDKVGHAAGPSGRKTQKEVQRIDRFVREVVSNYSRVVEDLNVVLLSDHGMANITKKIDIKGELDKLPLRHGEDYLGFYDSTMARFWIFHKALKECSERL